MTNRELDKWLAENVMGWNTTVLIEPIGEEYRTKEGNIGPIVDEWQPTESISDAFQVVEKMREKGFLMQIFSTTENNKESLEWVAAFFLKWAKGYEAIAKTPELAISLAAKKAIKAK